MSPGSPPWEEYLTGRFPAYLLPEAFRLALPEDVAARFLELDHAGTGSDPISLLRAASVIAARSADVQELCLTRLPDLRLRLPRRSEAERRARVGELRGLLDVPATLQRRMTGRLHEVIFRARTVPRTTPENVLVSAVVSRLLSILRDLRAAGVFGR
jgi:hypothetical protein